MKTPLLVAHVVLFSSVAFAQKPAKTTAPDFVGNAPRRHIDRSLVASPDAAGTIDPWQAVTFEHDRAQLSPLAASQVDKAAAWLKQHPQYRLVLGGHADATGPGAY